MELVTLAHITVNRNGTAGTVGCVPRKSVSRIRGVLDRDPLTLREAVIEITVEHGEMQEGLIDLRQERSLQHSQTGHQDAFYFNVQGYNTQYGDVYAICFSYPALKIGDRYFRMEEVSA